MHFVNSPYIIKKLYKQNLIWEIHSKEKNIYLTFDDGPNHETSIWILKTLDNFDAKASFFCVGNNIKKNPDILKKILAAKHTIGNHTFNHINGWKTKTDDYIKNVLKCNKYIETSLFRPPYGKIRPLQIHRLKEKYNIILWSVLSYDFDKNVTKQECLKNVIANTKKGSIVVFHDNTKAKDNLFYALPRFLEYFTKKGYKFKALTREICNQKD